MVVHASVDVRDLVAVCFVNLDIEARLLAPNWGGVWAAVLAPLLSSLRGRAYWAAWVVVGAVALPLVAFFVVPPIKGEPIPELWPRFPVAMMINGFWGFGTALFLRLTGADPRP